jgi:ribonucleoside-diphosphate reductase alpha chain
MLPFESDFAHRIYKQKYSRDGVEEWSDTVDRVVTAVGYSYIRRFMEDRVFIPGGRYLYACGRPVHNTSNCFAMRAVDSREGWSQLMADVTQTLMMGGGIGIDYSELRARGSAICGTGGEASGPLSLMRAIDSMALHIRQGGSRRSALYAGLDWQHPDVFEFINMKRRTQDEQEAKAKDFNHYLSMDLTNISVHFDRLFKLSYDKGNPHAIDVFNKTLYGAVTVGDPGFSFNLHDPRESLRNACSEFTSADSGDSCNLGTVYISRCKDKDHFAEAVKHAVKFLIRGALYTNRPTEDARQVARKNNRIGLGLGGIGEFLLQHESACEVTPLLREYLEVYAEVSDKTAREYSRKLGLAEPLAKRAIAPNGTTSILAETTGGIEPLFCASYLRSYWIGDEYKSEVVIDPVVNRLLALGRNPDSIWDSYDVGFEQRVKFQADIQDFVDMGISSTVNLPSWGSPLNNENNVEEKGRVIMKYIERLRGLTMYPDGAIVGQPLQRIQLSDALKFKERVIEAREGTNCKEGCCGL